jgi:hypothetical protein
VGVCGGGAGVGAGGSGIVGNVMRGGIFVAAIVGETANFASVDDGATARRVFELRLKSAMMNSSSR